MWNVTVHRRVEKFFKKIKRSDKKLYQILSETFVHLVRELELNGPELTGWKNFSRLSNQPGNPKYHCHMSKYQGTIYVACWELEDNELQLIEVYHVSSHENAPY